MKQFFASMKINIPVRFRNWTFWLGVLGVIGTALAVDPATITSWAALGNVLLDFISNPYKIGCVACALIGVLTDPTTAGIGDSARALTYTKPNKEP